jgi:CMP-N-acetylneuraminic acid synthetase
MKKPDTYDSPITNHSSLKVLAIIPARGGSKGVPGKNIKELGGKPLIQYAVDCALDSNLIENIVINSDDQDILDIVASKGSNRIIKQKRPRDLGLDNSSIVDVVMDILQKLKTQYDIIILLQPTSPLRTAADIESIIQNFIDDDNLEGVISVIPLQDMHPARMYKINDDKTLKPLIEDNESQRRQDLEPVYYRNGCFYAVRTKAFLEQKTFMPKNKKAYVMNPDHLLNIDTPIDIKIAEVLIKAWQNKEL